jgi:murein L,D-transpeptidase YcbB/YkuD
MSYVVLNPYWNIPSRILEEELLPSLVNREDYFERQGIEVVEVNGSRRVRQRPGPQNPLGRVKFMFPNPHDTYLHDTSRPQYFQYPIRAFSHGCMRVQEPLNFLELLLRNDDQWDPARVEQIFASEQETSIRLRTPVPVHVEYYVVRVDDEGRANFAADIYRYDRERISPSSPDQLRCTPAARPDHRLVLGADGRPMLRDNAGNLIDPASLQGGSGDPTTGDFGP